MLELLTGSVYFGVLLSLGTFALGLWLKRKFHAPLFNPLLVSVVLTILVLLVLGMDYDTYYTGAHYINYLLTPATVCLAIPLYRQLSLLRKTGRPSRRALPVGCSPAWCACWCCRRFWG